MAGGRVLREDPVERPTCLAKDILRLGDLRVVARVHQLRGGHADLADKLEELPRADADVLLDGIPGGGSVAELAELGTAGLGELVDATPVALSVTTRPSSSSCWRAG